MLGLLSLIFMIRTPSSNGGSPRVWEVLWTLLFPTFLSAAVEVRCYIEYVQATVKM